MQIDIRKTVADKNKTVAKRIPSFIYSIIEKAVHLKEINQILKRNQGLKGADFAAAALHDMGVKGNIKYIDKEALSGRKRLLFVSNHPLGGLDGLILITEFGKQFGETKFIVNDFLLQVEPLKDIFIPVNKTGKSSFTALQNIRKAYASECNIVNFPAGLCSRLQHGKITDLQWKSSFVKEAVESKRDIVPVYFSGRNSMAFYRLAKLRKFLGIKFNVEMMFLPHEMFRQKKSVFDIVIGKPVTCEQIAGSGKSIKEWCNKIRKTVYENGSSYSAR